MSAEDGAGAQVLEYPTRVIAAMLDQTASAPNMPATARARELRRLGDELKRLSGRAYTLANHADLAIDAGAVVDDRALAEAREDADLRDEAIRRGLATPEQLDAAGYLSHSELDEREEDGTLTEALDRRPYRKFLHPHGARGRFIVTPDRPRPTRGEDLRVGDRVKVPSWPPGEGPTGIDRLDHQTQTIQAVEHRHGAAQAVVTTDGDHGTDWATFGHGEDWNVVGHDDGAGGSEHDAALKRVLAAAPGPAAAAATAPLDNPDDPYDPRHYLPPAWDPEVAKIAGREDAERYLRGLGLDADLDVSSWDGVPGGVHDPSPQFYREIAQASHDALAKYPFLTDRSRGDYWGGIRTLRPEDPTSTMLGEMGVTRDVWAITTPGSGADGSGEAVVGGKVLKDQGPWYVNLNPGERDDGGGDGAYDDETNAGGTALFNALPYGRMTHEIGHVNMATLGIGGGQTMDQHNDLVTLLSESGVGPSSIAPLSPYAASNPAESYAEMFAALTVPNGLDSILPPREQMDDLSPDERDMLPLVQDGTKAAIGRFRDAVNEKYGEGSL